MTDINFTQIESNGINMRLAHAGEGPLVLLIHGWPESWYSWRHQLIALANAGYHAVAPDMRGYGGTSAPAEPEAYRIDHLAKDVVGIIDHFNQATATIIGHDWGSMVVWYTALLHPDRINGVMGMSVPYGGRAKQAPLKALKRPSATISFTFFPTTNWTAITWALPKRSTTKIPWAFYQGSTLPQILHEHRL